MRHQPSVVPLELLPDGSTACIAGGYAACPALASDMDVWVMGVDNLALTRQQILNHLYEQAADYGVGCTIEPQDSTERDVIDGCGYDNLPLNILKVAVVRLPQMLPIHIMVVDVESPLALLMSFDVSTHQVAIGANNTSIRGPEWTELEVEPRVIRNHDNPKTIARLAKITARYAPLRAKEIHVQA